MEVQAAFVLAVAIGVLIGIISGRLRPHQALGGGGFLCAIAGILSPEDVLASFANPVVVVLTLLVVMTPLLVDAIDVPRRLQEFLHPVQPSPPSHLHHPPLSSWMLGRLLLFLGLLSSLMSNTAVLAMVLRAVHLARLPRVSEILLPVSYACILGGTVTLIGTSTNLLVAGTVQETTGIVLSFWDFTPIGLAILLFGLPVILLSRPLLAGTAGRAQDGRHLCRFRVGEQSPLKGKSIEEAGLRHLKTHFLTAVTRLGKQIVPVSPQLTLLPGDILHFAGERHQLQALLPASASGLEAVEDGDDLKLISIVLPNHSSFCGKTLRELNFRGRFDAAVVSIAGRPREEESSGRRDAGATGASAR